MSTPAPPFPLQAGPNDFLTLAQLKVWIQGMNPGVTTADDDVLQFIITAVSTDLLNRMGRSSITNTNYQEWYDGTGNPTLPIDNDPITSVNVLKFGNAIVPASPDHVQPGYIISRDKKFIQLVGGSAYGYTTGFGVPSGNFGGGGISGAYNRPAFVFPCGVSNIYIDYYAGYTTIPYDLGEACALVIDQDYKRRGWPDKTAIALPQDGGTTYFSKAEIPPRAWEIIWRYTPLSGR